MREDYLSIKAFSRALNRLNQPEKLQDTAISQCSRAVTLKLREQGDIRHPKSARRSARARITAGLLSEIIQEPSRTDFDTFLRRRYIENETREEIADEHDFSLSTCDRRLRDALTWAHSAFVELEQEAAEKFEKICRHNLPRQLPSFVGRADTIQKAMNRLGPVHREWQVILVGPPGIGKTSTALELAWMCHQRGYFDAIVWVSAKTRAFEPYQDTIKETTPSTRTLNELWDAIGERFNINLSEMPLDEKEKEVLRLLEEHCCLLVVDNFETLDEPDLIASFLSNLPLEGHSEALVTQRPDWRREEGRLITLSGMKPGESREFLRTEARDHSIESITAASDVTLNDIARETGGNPLAMQWFLGIVKRLKISPDKALDLLNESGSTNFMEFCFHRLYDSVGSQCQLIMQVLSLFPNPVPLGAIAKILNIPHRKLYRTLLPELYETLIVRSEPDGRPTLLPLARRFAYQQLLKSTRAEYQDLLERVGSYYSSFVTEHKQDYARLETEKDNILSVIDWCAQTGQLERIQCLVKGVTDFLYDKGCWQESLEYSRKAYEISKRRGDIATAAEFLLLNIGNIQAHQRQFEKALNTSREGLQLAREAADKRIKAHAIRIEALVERKLAEDDDSLRRAKRRYETVSQLFEAVGDLQWKEYTDGTISSIDRDLGRYQQAEQELQKQLQAAEERGDEVRKSVALCRYGTLRLNQKRFDEAISYFKQSLEIDKKLGRTLSEAYNYLKLARAYRGKRLPIDAESFAKKSLDLFTRLGKLRQGEEARTLYRELLRGPVQR